jgi:hypothetical protein
MKFFGEWGNKDLATKVAVGSDEFFNIVGRRRYPYVVNTEFDINRRDYFNLFYVSVGNGKGLGLPVSIADAMFDVVKFIENLDENKKKNIVISDIVFEQDMGTKAILMNSRSLWAGVAVGAAISPLNTADSVFSDSDLASVHAFSNGGVKLPDVSLSFNDSNVVYLTRPAKIHSPFDNAKDVDKFAFQRPGEGMGFKVVKGRISAEFSFGFQNNCYYVGAHSKKNWLGGGAIEGRVAEVAKVFEERKKIAGGAAQRVGVNGLKLR